MNQVWGALDWAFGLHVKPEYLTTVQVVVRTLAAYTLGWALLRLARNRLLSRYTTFDVVLGFVLGSTLSRGINGSAPPQTTFVAVTLLVVLHQLLTWISYRFKGANEFLNAHSQPVIRSGRVIVEQMRKSHITENDLGEALRLKAHTTELERIEEARIERNGEISFVKRRQVVEVGVHAGVQTIRIELAG